MPISHQDSEGVEKEESAICHTQGKLNEKCKDESGISHHDKEGSQDAPDVYVEWMLCMKMNVQGRQTSKPIGNGLGYEGVLSTQIALSTSDNLDRE